MNWNDARWHNEIVRLSKGLTLRQAARRLGKGYIQTCIKLRKHRYTVKETRGGFKGKRKLTPAIIKRIDWSQNMAALGRKYNVSRERIRQVRNALGKPRA